MLPLDFANKDFRSSVSREISVRFMLDSYLEKLFYAPGGKEGIATGWDSLNWICKKQGYSSWTGYFSRSVPECPSVLESFLWA